MADHSDETLKIEGRHIWTPSGQAMVCELSSPSLGNELHHEPLTWVDPRVREAEARGRRMVACWNACKGISTYDLEKSAVPT